MPRTPSHLDPVRSQAERAQARIYAIFARAHDEVRGLTDDERREYERLRDVYVRAVLAA